MLGGESHGASERLRERRSCLSRNPVHEIQPDICKPGTARRPVKRLRLVSGVEPAEGAELRIGKTLHADTQPIHPGGAPAREFLPVCRRGIDLRRDLGVGRKVKTGAERVKNALRFFCREERGRPAADKDGVHRIGRKRGAVRPQFPHEGVHVARARRGIDPREGAKVAIEALPTAERDMDINTDVRFHRPVSALP